ncbi:hypothetical protein [Mycobacterium sp. DL440]|uniref:hypothetical protein n=1 Tax=Mycobacterium sp. DL440 TaxID=2675523 RepID=UPI00141FA352|nr:hypothetical protein [Mycobacterium sp. DL440]
MSRIHRVISRYAACRAVLRGGVDIFSVGDPAGAQLNAAVRKAQVTIDDAYSDIWQPLLRAANAVRWRRLLQPQPNALSPGLREIVDAVQREADGLRNVVNDTALVIEIANAAVHVGETDSPVGAVLLQSIHEVGVDRCVVVTNKRSTRAAVAEWLHGHDVAIVAPGEYDRIADEVEQTYVVGPPNCFPAAIISAPATEAVTFMMPAWYSNTALPASALTGYTGQSRIRTRVRPVGDIEQPTESTDTDPPLVDNFFPAPVWGSRQSEDREPASDEVEARKILLCGGFRLWLDDGERIRSLDPCQPEGDRVSYEAVGGVRPGTYLVLREGATERGAMYDAAVAGAGDRAAGMLTTQLEWKHALAQRLERDGADRVASALRSRGIKEASRVRAWIDPTLICPKREASLSVVLDWLGIPQEPTFTNAVTLRRGLYRAIADLRKELESAASQSDLNALERDGFLRLDLHREGFRSMIVTRVIARAPFTEIVLRSQTRIPFPDEGAKWLE